MISIDEFQNDIAMLVPNAKVIVDPAESATGSTWIDINSEEGNITIEYKPSQGFGLYSDSDIAYGVRPDEIYRSASSLLKRISMLLIEKKEDIYLKELRELLGLTQSDFSISSGQKQPSISKIENRKDVQLSTINKFITALGGTLEIKVHFDEFDVSIDLNRDKQSSS